MRSIRPQRSSASRPIWSLSKFSSECGCPAKCWRRPYVPEHLHEVAPEGLAALLFLPDDSVVLTTRRGHFRMTSHDSIPVCRASILFVCTMGGVPMEFMGAYAPQANSENSDAANS